MKPSHVEAIFITSEAGAVMRRVEAVEAIPGKGLRGDRYCLSTGHYSEMDTCEVTLIEAEALERMEAKCGVRVSDGEHRRNIVTRGLVHAELGGCRFQIGDVILEYDRTRPPCGYLQRITEPGMTRAMGEGAGICVCIVQGGVLRAGDAIVLLPEKSSRPFRKLP